MNLPAPNAYPQVGGRLAQFYRSWSNFTSDIWVLQAVRGYNSEFVCEPFQVNKPHGIVFFSDEEKKLIDLEVQNMLQKVLLDAPHLTRDNSFLTCLSYQRSVAILGLLLI